MEHIGCQVVSLIGLFFQKRPEMLRSLLSRSHPILRPSGFLSRALLVIDSGLFYLPGISRWGWIFLERTRILSGIRFTRHCIVFVGVETKRFVGSNVNVILTRQTCSQRPSRAAGGKRRALAFYFGVRICHVFLISRYRVESHLGLCTTSVLANRIPPRICKIRQSLWPKHVF